MASKPQFQRTSAFQFRGSMFDSDLAARQRRAQRADKDKIYDPETGLAYDRKFDQQGFANPGTRDNDQRTSEGYHRAMMADPGMAAEQKRLEKMWSTGKEGYRGERMVKVPLEYRDKGLFRYAKVARIQGPALPGDERNTPAYTRYEMRGYDKGWDEYNKAVMAQRFHVSSSAKRAKAARGKTGQSQFVVGTESALGAGGTERAAQQTPSQASTKQSVALRGQRRRIA